MKDAVVLHHSDIPGDKSQFGQVYAYHHGGAGGKWRPGHGIQYHWFGEKSGLFIQARGEDTVSWHAGNLDMNKRSVGVCLAGDFTREKPADAQLEALVRIVTGIQTRWGIPDARIFLHREVRDEPTLCPGIDLRALLLAKREEMLDRRVPSLQRALQRAKGLRQIRLTRLLDRLTKLLGGA